MPVLEGLELGPHSMVGLKELARTTCITGVTAKVTEGAGATGCGGGRASGIYSSGSENYLIS